MRHYFPNVPKLGNVAVSRHAQERVVEEGISDEEFETVLFKGRDTPEGFDVVWRELNGIRLVILRNPQPFRGALLVKTVFRVQRQAAVQDRS